MYCKTIVPLIAMRVSAFVVFLGSSRDTSDGTGRQRTLERRAFCK